MDCVKLCIELGSNVDARNNDGYTPLHCASLFGHGDVVRLLLDASSTVNATDNEGWTPLHHASYGGHANIGRMLLDACAIVDTHDNDGHTPLYLAIRWNRRDIAKLLIDRGALVSNVTLDSYLPTIPDWINTFISSRSNCRNVAIVVIGIHKYHRTNVTGNNDINVLKLISKHIWTTRMEEVYWI